MKGFSYLLDEKNAGRLIKEFESFGSSARLDEKTTQRIRSSVMRKAGFEMNTDIKLSKNKKKISTLIAIALAAALSVTAGAAYVISHKKSIDSIYGESSGEVFEQRKLISGKTYSGRHFDMTIDTVLSNGEMLSIIATAVPNDDFGKEVIKREDDVDLNTDISFGSDLQNGCGSSSEVIDGNAVISFTTLLSEYKDSFTLPIEARYFDMDDNKYHTIKRFDVKAVKNLDNREYVSNSGDIITLCDIGMSGRDLTLGEGKRDNNADALRDIVFEHTDKSTESFKDVSLTTELSENETFYYHNAALSFSKIINSSDITAIIINGVRFEYRAA